MGTSKRSNNLFYYNLLFKTLNLGIILIIVLIVFLFLFRSFKYGIRNYPLGELLFNYKCGFIRRGLIGSFLSIFSSFFNLNPFSLLRFCIPLFYIIVFVILGFKVKSNIILLAAVFISPYGFMFYINDWGVYGYKDIFIILFYILWLKNLQSEPTFKQKIFYYGIPLTGFLIHENMLVVSVPFFLFFLNLQRFIKKDSPSINNISEKKQFIFSVLFVLYVLIVYVAGNYEIEKKVMCLEEQFKSLEFIYKVEAKHGIEYALSWLDKSLFFGYNFVHERNFNSFILYHFSLKVFFIILFLFLLTILFIEFKKLKFAFKKSIIYLSLVIVSFFFLIFFTYDWTRWLHLFYMHFIITLIYLMPKNLIDFTKKTKFSFVFIAMQLFLFLGISIPSHFYSIEKITHILAFFK